MHSDEYNGGCGVRVRVFAKHGYCNYGRKHRWDVSRHLQHPSRACAGDLPGRRRRGEAANSEESSAIMILCSKRRKFGERVSIIYVAPLLETNGFKDPPCESVPTESTYTPIVHSGDRGRDPKVNQRHKAFATSARRDVEICRRVAPGGHQISGRTRGHACKG